MNTKLARILALACAFALLGAGATARLGASESVQEKRADARETSAETLAKLYKLQPSAMDAIAKASGGYATFHNFGMKIFFVGGGKGSGIAHNNKTGADTFMKMLEAQAGLGLGVKKFSVVFVFGTQDALTQFVEKGWEFSGDATAAAKSGDQGVAYQGAIAVSPDVWMYQITDAGLAAELAIKGTKYYKDDDLN